MDKYLHGITTSRDSDIVTSAQQTAGGIQVVIGSAPVNLLDDPEKAVNTPFLINSRADVKETLGLSADYRYTLMQSVLASLQKHGVAPIILINVLDPKKTEHVTAVASKEYELIRGSVTIEEEGILLNSIKVSATGGDISAEADIDFTTAFDTNGYAVVAVSDDGKLSAANKVNIAYTKLNPEGVTEGDIIGGIDEAGVRTGIELVDEIYNRFEIIPEIILAPGYSRKPAVAAALEAKAELAGDLTNAVAVLDLESETTVTLDKIVSAKNKLGVFSRWNVICYPKVLMGGVEIYASAVAGALLQKERADNNDVPVSPDNKEALIEGLVLEGGKEVHYTQRQVNEYLNANGILSFVYMGGWKCWGNNTAAFPDDTDPNNRFIKNVMMSNYLENRFKTEYLSQIGSDADYKFIDSIVSGFNATLNALVPSYVAGAEVVFDKDENPISEILKGHFRFHTRYADYTPAEWLSNTFTWSSKILEEALEGGSEE